MRRVQASRGVSHHLQRHRHRHFGASRVRLIPAAPGTGIIAGASVRAVCEMAGIKNVLTKSYGSTNPVNSVKAALAALARLRTREMVRELRGVEV